MPVRIYDIAKKLGIESKEVLARAKELGITTAKVPSSSLDKITAEFLEQEFRGRVSVAPTPPAAAVSVEPRFIVPEAEPPPAPAEPVAESPGSPAPAAETTPPVSEAPGLPAAEPVPEMETPAPAMELETETKPEAETPPAPKV